MATPKLTQTAPSRDSVYNTGDTVSEAVSINSDCFNDSVHSSGAACSVDYETRDGSARNGHNYHSLKGTLVSSLKVAEHSLRALYRFC